VFQNRIEKIFYNDGEIQSLQFKEHRIQEGQWMCKGADVMKVRNIPLGMLSSKEQGEVKPDDASKKELMYDLAGGMCCERGFDEHLLMGYVDMHNEETKQKGAFAVCMWKEASQEVISKIED